MTRTRRATATLFCTFVVTSALCACSGQTEPSSPPTSSAPAVCDDLDALQASVERLQNAKVGEGALSVLSAEMAKLQSELNQLSADASAEYSSEVRAVKSGAQALKSSIKAASTDPSAASLSAVADDVRTVASATRVLGDAVSGTC